MNNNELAIKINNVSKQYRLGAIGGGTLKGDLQSFIARKKGLEDPNSKIGSEAALHKNEKFLALDGINLEIKKGEVVGIIGHNGAGKSTLLKLLSRVTAPTTGSIGINGRIASMLEVGTGFHPELTGRENVYMNGAILGMTKAEIDSKFDQIVEFSEIAQFIDTPVKRYSSGMYVKLAFSVAAHLDSEIMIMDEVLAVGDMAFQKKCLQKMSSASREDGKTVLYVSHNMSTITQLCERCIVLDKGKIIYDGDVDTAISIYMGDTVKQMGTDIDLSQIRMPHLSKNVRAKITHLSLTGKEIPMYEFGETIPFKIDIHSNIKIDDLCLRVEIRTSGNIPVGLTMIKNFSSVDKDADSSFCFEMYTDGLVTGDYVICLVLYEVDNLGNFIDVDAVYPAFTFSVIDPNNKIALNWVHSNWGNIKFIDLKLKN